MKRYLRLALWLAVFGCLWLPVLDDPPLHSGAYVQDVTAHGAALRKITRGDEELGWRVQDGTGREVAAGRSHGRRHEFAFQGLEPGQQYTFAVLGAGGVVQERGSFRTPPKADGDEVRFCAFGDSGAVPWWVWLQRAPLFWPAAAYDWLPPQGRVAELGARVAAESPQFVLHLGDIVYPWGFAGHYTSAFFRPFDPFLRQAPIYAVLGNHDVMNDHGHQALANFRAPSGGMPDGRCWSMAWGGVRVIGLDLNWGRAGADGSATAKAAEGITRDHPAVQFLQKELQTCDEPWIVVASHFPIFSTSRQGDRQDLIDTVLPILKERHVDLYLAGHDHTYQRFGAPGEMPLVVSGGGGKSLYEVSTRADAQCVASKENYLVVEAAGAAMAVRAQGFDGATLDRLDLKLGPERSALVRRTNPRRADRIDALLKKG